jgi:single-strand DNA-binding protein
MSAQNVNVVVISGNLTRDPELRHTGSGTAVCNMRVAVNSRRKDGQTGEWVDKPNYFDVTVWGGLGENCAQYLSKGRPVTIEGRLDWREWEDQGGNKRQSVEIIASTVQFGSKKEGGGTSTSGSSETATDNSTQEEIAAGNEHVGDQVGGGQAVEEDIPF